MVELVLFIVLLFLPINITPPLAVWMYEKLLYVSSPFLSAFEAIHVVLLIMNTSQKVVNEMEENPFIVKVPSYINLSMKIIFLESYLTEWSLLF